MSNCTTCPSQNSCGKKEDTCGVQNNPNNHIAHVIGVMSGKGGVGKSSVSVLMAKELQKRGYHVGVMDADITGPSIPRLFGMEHAAAISEHDLISPVVDNDGIKLMSLNFLMEDENQPVIWRGPIVGNAVKQFWTDVLWGDLDYLFIDMPPGTGDVALTIMQSMPINGILMVTTPQPMVSMIVSKAINMCRKANVEVLGVIENMSYIVCPDCGKHINLFANDQNDDFLATNKVSLWAQLPMLQSVAQIHSETEDETQASWHPFLSPAVDKLLAIYEKSCI